MNETSIGDHHGPGPYEIRLKGHLDARWAAWFDGLSLRRINDGTTVIEGPVADQAALHGLLQKVRDIGLPLIWVTRVETGQAGSPPSETPQSIDPQGERHDRH
jgi:hypothetical protein